MDAHKKAVFNALSVLYVRGGGVLFFNTCYYLVIGHLLPPFFIPRRTSDLLTSPSVPRIIRYSVWCLTQSYSI